MAEYYRYYGVNIPAGFEIKDVTPSGVDSLPWHELGSADGVDFQEVQIIGNYLFNGRHGGIIIRVIDAFGVVKEARLGVLEVASPITFLYSPNYDLKIMEVDCPYNEEGFSWGDEPMLPNVSGGTGHYRFFLEDFSGQKDLYICEKNGYIINAETGAITGTPKHVSGDSGGTFFVTVKDLLWEEGQWDQNAVRQKIIELESQDHTLFPDWSWSATEQERDAFCDFVVANGNFANNTRAVIGRNLYPVSVDGHIEYRLSDGYELVALSSATIECNRERILPHFHFIDESYGAVFPIIEYRTNMGEMLSQPRYWPRPIDDEAPYNDQNPVARQVSDLSIDPNYNARQNVRNRYKWLLTSHDADIDSALVPIFYQNLPSSGPDITHFHYQLVPIPNGQRIIRDLSTYIEGGWRFEDTVEDSGAYRFTATGLAPDFQISQNGVITGVAKKAAPQRLAIITAEDRRGKKISHILRIGSIAAMFGFDPEMNLRFPQQVMAKYQIGGGYTSCKLVSGVEGFIGVTDSMTDNTKINRLFIPADKIVGGNSDLVLTADTSSIVVGESAGKDFFVYMNHTMIPPNLKVYLWWGENADRTMQSLQQQYAQTLTIDEDNNYNVYTGCAITYYGMLQQSVLRVTDLNPVGKGLNIGIILGNYSEKISIPAYDMQLVAFDKGLAEDGVLSMDYAAGRQAVKMVHLLGIVPPLIWKPNTKWCLDSPTNGTITLTTTGDNPDIIPVPTFTGTAMEVYWILADGGVPNYKLDMLSIIPPTGVAETSIPYLISQQSPSSPTGGFIAGEIYGGMPSWTFEISMEDSLQPYPEIEPRPQVITKRVVISEIDIDPTFWAVDSLQDTYLVDGQCHRNTAEEITFYIGAIPNIDMIRAYFGPERFKKLGAGAEDFDAYVVAADADLETVKAGIIPDRAWESGNLYITNRGKLTGSFSKKSETVKYNELVKVFYRDTFYPIQNEWYGPRILPLPTKANDAWAKMLQVELQIGVYYESDPLFTLDGYDPDKIVVNATGIPDGLSFNKITGRISGVPTTVSGASNVTITLTYMGNSWTGPYGGTITQSGSVSITGEGQLAPVLDAPLSVNVTNSNLGSLIAGRTYSLSDSNQVLQSLIYVANGGVAPRTWSVSFYDSALFETPILNSDGKIVELTVKPDVSSSGGEIVLQVTDSTGDVVEVPITFTQIQISNLSYNGKHGVSSWQILSNGIDELSQVIRDENGVALTDSEIMKAESVNLSDVISGVIGTLRVTLEKNSNEIQIPYFITQSNGQIFLSLKEALVEDGLPVFTETVLFTDTDGNPLYNIFLRISDDSGNVITERLYFGNIIGPMEIEDEPWADIPRAHVGQSTDPYIEYDLTPYFSDLGEGVVTLSKEDSILSGAWSDEFDTLFKFGKIDENDQPAADGRYHLYYKYPTSDERGADQTQTLTLQFKESEIASNTIERHILILGVYDDVEWVRLSDYENTKEFIPWHYLGGDSTKRNDQYPPFVEISGTSYRIDLSQFIKYATGEDVQVIIDLNTLPSGWSAANFNVDSNGKLLDWHYLEWTYPSGPNESPEGHITLTLSDDGSEDSVISLKVGKVYKMLTWTGDIEDLNGNIEDYEFDANGSPRGSLAIQLYDEANKEWSAPEPTLIPPGIIGTPAQGAGSWSSTNCFDRKLGIVEGGRTLEIQSSIITLQEPYPPVLSLAWKNIFPTSNDRGIILYSVEFDTNGQPKLAYRYNNGIPDGMNNYIHLRMGNLVAITIIDTSATDSRFTKYFRLGEVYSTTPQINWIEYLSPGDIEVNTSQNIVIPLATFGPNSINKIGHYEIISTEGWTVGDLAITGSQLQIPVTAPATPTPSGDSHKIVIQVKYETKMSITPQQKQCNIYINAIETGG